MTDEQKILVNHSVDLSRKIDSMKFNLDQLNVGKDTFVRLLEESLNKQDSDVEDAEVIN
jgi:hypothetical protein